MSQSLLLADQLGVRFYVKLPAIEGYVYDRVDFTITGQDGDAYASSVAYSETLPKNKAGHYGFTFYENTVQMADTITATLYYTENGEQKTLVKEYAVKEYFETFDATYAEAPEAFTKPVVDMIKATADLGHYVQIYLDESRTEWSVENGDHAEMDKFYTTYTADDVAEATEAVASHALAVEGTCTDIKNLGYALYMDSATSLRVTIVPASGFTGTFTATVDGEEATVTKVSKTKYMVEVKGIMANGLSKKHTIVIGTENGSVTLTGSGLTYVQMMLRAGASNANIQNAAVAIYRYSKFADILKPE